MLSDNRYRKECALKSDFVLTMGGGHLSQVENFKISSVCSSSRGVYVTVQYHLPPLHPVFVILSHLFNTVPNTSIHSVSKEPCLVVTPGCHLCWSLRTARVSGLWSLTSFVLCSYWSSVLITSDRSCTRQGDRDGHSVLRMCTLSECGTPVQRGTPKKI